MHTLFSRLVCTRHLPGFPPFYKRDQSRHRQRCKILETRLHLAPLLYVDNKSLVQAWQSQTARSSQFSDALKDLAETVLEFNLHLSVLHIPSKENPADQPSRKLSPADSTLVPRLWLRLQDHPSFGGPQGHSIDLMSLDSNVQADLDGLPLRYFTPYPSPFSSGVDFFAQNLSQKTDGRLRNPYIFPPILLIGQVLNHLRVNGLSCTMVIPDVHPRRYWWPLVWHSSHPSLKLARKGEQRAILTPSRQGFSPTFRLPWDLWAFRV
ncbi:hypothetical protein QZH41_019551 [Actinostola sp. cb2023]|nr:hypothetical protein QZH41_019551 [Actinostola sp. cb2023]